MNYSRSSCMILRIVMKKVSLLVGLTLISGLAFGDTLPKECNVLLTKSLSVSVVSNSPQVDSTHTVSKLNTLFGKSSGESVSKIGSVTHDSFNFDQSYSVYGLETSGGYCALLSGKVTLPVTPIITYMPADLSKESCAYREIMIHELKHVNYKLQVHAIIGAKVTKLVKTTLSTPVMYASAIDANKALQLIANQLTTDIENIAKLELSREDGFDNPSEYKRVYDMCPIGFDLLYRKVQ